MLAALALVAVVSAAAAGSEQTAPVVSTGGPTAIGLRAATVKGTIDTKGLATTWWVEYGLTDYYIWRTGAVTIAAGQAARVSVEFRLTDLKPGTRYHYRLVAESEGGTAAGADRTFVTVAEPKVVTRPADPIGTTSATLRGRVNPRGTPGVWWFEYGTTTSYGARTARRDTGAGTKELAVSRTVRGLERNRVYHFRLVVEHAEGVVVGADQSFSTGRAPEVLTAAPTAVGSTTAVLNGAVDPNGRPTTWWFEYGTTTRYGSRTPVRDAGAGTVPVAVSTALTGLRPGVVYHARIVAENGSGRARGRDVSFATGSLPAAATGPVTAIGPTSATVNGTVDPNGQATTVWFEYGRTAAYGFRTTAQQVGSGRGEVPVTARLTGLQPGVRYHYRLVADSEAGTVAGRDASFGTIALPRDAAGRPIRCTLVGTPGPDVLRGTDGPDRICGLGGDDRIDGRGGDDVIHGGPGNDVLLGGPGNNALYGALGRDELIGGPGADRLDGGAGADGLVGGAGNDRLLGGPGNDTLVGGPGNDVLAGGPGADRLFARDGRRDVVAGGTGADRAFADRLDRVGQARRVG